MQLSLEAQQYEQDKETRMQFALLNDLLWLVRDVAREVCEERRDH